MAPKGACFSSVIAEYLLLLLLLTMARALCCTHSLQCATAICGCNSCSGNMLLNPNPMRKKELVTRHLPHGDNIS